MAEITKEKDLGVTKPGQDTFYPSINLNADQLATLADIEVGGTHKMTVTLRMRGKREILEADASVSLHGDFDIVSAEE